MNQDVRHPHRDDYLPMVKLLADEGYVMCIDLTGVDYLRHMDRPLPEDVERERFEVVVNLLDLSNRRRVRLRVQVPESDPVVASLFDVHPGAEAMERESFVIADQSRHPEAIEGIDAFLGKRRPDFR